MANPYNERFLKALEHLQDTGAFTSLRECCDVLGFHPNYISGFRKGSRNVQPEHLSKLFIKYRVSLNYLLIGNLPIMEKERDTTPPEDESELAIKLAKAEATIQLQEKFLSAKDAEINFLRELLRMSQKDTPDNSIQES